MIFTQKVQEVLLAQEDYDEVLAQKDYEEEVGQWIFVKKRRNKMEAEGCRSRASLQYCQSTSEESL